MSALSADRQGFVVDASVVVKWFFPEIHADDARRLLREGLELISPDLIRAEVSNVLWKKWRRGEIPSETASGILGDLLRFPLRVRSSAPLMETAWSVARRFETSFYDSLYVALAAQTDRPLITADRRLYNALGEDSPAGRLLWVEELP